MHKENAVAVASAQLLAPLVNRNTVAAAVGAAATYALLRLPPHIRPLSLPILSSLYILPLLLLITLVACFYLYYSNWLAVPPTVHHRAWPASHITAPKLPRPSPPADHPAVRLTRAVLSQPALASFLSRPYSPTPWLFSGHLQTLFTALAPPSALRTPTVVYKRELLHVKPLREGLYEGQIALDWALSCSPYSPPSTAAAEQPPAVQTIRFRATDPTVVIVHGLAGGSGEHYIRGLVHHLSTSTARRFRCVVFNQRGCGGQQLISPQAYCGAYTGDLHQALHHIHARLPTSPLILIGYSLGANVVSRYVGEHPDETVVTACVAVSNPWDCVHSCRELDRTWWKRLTYSQQLAKNLCTVFSHHTTAFSTSPTIHLPSAFTARTLREFDTLCTSAAFEYATVDDYYRDASSAAFVSRMRTACLFLSSYDDPICDGGGIPVDECAGNECCLLLTVPCGGHSMCFYEGWRAGSYCVRLIRQYAESLMDVLDGEAGRKGGEQHADGWVSQPPPMVEAEKEEVVSDGLIAPKGLDNDELDEQSSHQRQPPLRTAADHAQRIEAGIVHDTAPRFSSSPQPSHSLSAATDTRQQAEAEADSTAAEAVQRKTTKGAAAGGKAKKAKVEQDGTPAAAAASETALTVAVDDVLDTLIAFTRRTRLLVQSSHLTTVL